MAVQFFAGAGIAATIAKVHVEGHENCVPPDQIAKVEKQVGEAKKLERRLKQKFQDTLVDVRRGDCETTELWEMLNKYNDEESELRRLELHDAISTAYHEKMRLVDRLLNKGVKYLAGNPRELDNLVNDSEVDFFVLYFNTSVMTDEDWRNTNNLLYELDMVQIPAGGWVPERPLVQKLRDGKVITPDVLAEFQELSDKPLLRCDDAASMETCRDIIQHPGCRLVRMLCPGYPISRAEFRCGDSVHGTKYSTHGSREKLKALLEKLDLSEDHNILIFGETGVGIGDTKEIDQDHKNVKEILATLELVDKLDAILFLLKPNTAWLTKAFDFCMTELLSHLHRDTTPNILFGFTNSRASNFTLGDTRIPLTSLLKSRGTNINLGYANTFFFDTEGFRFLALYKLHGKQMDEKRAFDDSWANGMTQPLVATARAAALTKEGWEKQMAELSRITAWSENLEKNLIIMQTYPKRTDLPHPKPVCFDDACFTITRDTDTGNMVKLYNKACHDNCDKSLFWCKAFFEGGWWASLGYRFSKGNVCKVCAHSWKVHMRISYNITLETRPIQDAIVAGKLKTEQEKQQAIESTVQQLKSSWSEINEEHRFANEALAKFGFYMRENASSPTMTPPLVTSTTSYKMKKENKTRSRFADCGTSKGITRIRLTCRNGPSPTANAASQATMTSRTSLTDCTLKHFNFVEVMPKDGDVFGSPLVSEPVNVPLKKAGRVSRFLTSLKGWTVGC
ncbi:hypothetical protein QBC38DRAFT_547845 [Podospora fimiseda]|uniref:Uncharacterized protein n=1 Tax=Podospora fimiseda TaxID=252190 RepID=A0AAN7BIW9_9PEZI|nr:hypothetical protein QBC38DRAFT_547845 [Podospora fimiseda]